jgi:hypothetical protein
LVQVTILVTGSSEAMGKCASTTIDPIQSFLKINKPVGWPSTGVYRQYGSFPYVLILLQGGAVAATQMKNHLPRYSPR